MYEGPLLLPRERTLPTEILYTINDTGPSVPLDGYFPLAITLPAGADIYIKKKIEALMKHVVAALSNTAQIKKWSFKTI
jgi:hypothetical protein